MGAQRRMQTRQLNASRASSSPSSPEEEAPECESTRTSSTSTTAAAAAATNVPTTPSSEPRGNNNNYNPTIVTVTGTPSLPSCTNTNNNVQTPTRKVTTKTSSSASSNNPYSSPPAGLVIRGTPNSRGKELARMPPIVSATPVARRKTEFSAFATPKTEPAVPLSTLTSTSTSLEGSKRVRTPNRNDVLLGRGGAINNHPGNKQFRSIVGERKGLYNLVSSTKVDKARISQEVVDRVKVMEPRGRFLKKDGDCWVEVEPTKALAKTSQALREGAPALRASGGRGGSKGPLPVASVVASASLKVPSLSQSRGGGKGRMSGTKRTRSSRLTPPDIDILDPPVIKKVKPVQDIRIEHDSKEEETVVHPTIVPIGGGHRGKQLIFPKEQEKEQEHNTSSNQKDDTKDASNPKDIKDINASKPSSRSDISEQKLPHLTQSQDDSDPILYSRILDTNQTLFTNEGMPIVPKAQNSQQRQQSPLPLQSDVCFQENDPELDSIFKKEVKRQSSHNCGICNFEHLNSTSSTPPPNIASRDVTTPALWPSDRSFTEGLTENIDYERWLEGTARRQQSLAISAIGDDAEDPFSVEIPSGEVNVPTGDLYPFQDNDSEEYFDSWPGDQNEEFPI